MGGVNRPILKVRNLLEDKRKRDLCLKNLIMELNLMSKECAALEFSNSDAKSLKSLKKMLREFRTGSFAEFEARVKNEVSEEIALFLSSKPKGKPRGRTENITEYNARRTEERIHRESMEKINKNNQNG